MPAVAIMADGLPDFELSDSVAPFTALNVGINFNAPLLKQTPIWTPMQTIAPHGKYVSRVCTTAACK